MKINTKDGLFLIRQVQKEDNGALTDIIIDSLAEFGATGEGFACNDAETQAMYEAYQESGRVYYVLEKLNGNTKPLLVGGGGIAPLKDSADICEFVKMYFLPEVRGLGMGRKMLELCISEAKNMGYKQMYLETLEQMYAARALYEKFDFKQIESPIGCTGHYSCDIFYMKLL